jgi:hypothetical protein
LELFLPVAGPAAAQHGAGVDRAHQILRVGPDEGEAAQRLQPHHVIAKDSEVAAHHQGNRQLEAEVLRGGEGRLPRLDQEHFQLEAPRAHPLLVLQEIDCEDRQKKDKQVVVEEILVAEGQQAGGGGNPALRQ